MKLLAKKERGKDSTRAVFYAARIVLPHLHVLKKYDHGEKENDAGDHSRDDDDCQHGVFILRFGNLHASTVTSIACV